MKRIETVWVPERKVIDTRLQGPVDLEDARRWKASLEDVVLKLPEKTRFKMLVDFHGYEPADLDVHKSMREAVPRTLARFGFRTAFADFFPEAELAVTRERGIVCYAAAYVHHDPTKMERYQREVARPNEKFFTDRDAAERWLDSLK